MNERCVSPEQSQEGDAHRDPWRHSSVASPLGNIFWSTHDFFPAFLKLSQHSLLSTFDFLSPSSYSQDTFIPFTVISSQASLWPIWFFSWKKLHQIRLYLQFPFLPSHYCFTYSSPPHAPCFMTLCPTSFSDHLLLASESNMDPFPVFKL